MGSKDVLITFLKKIRKEKDMSQNEFSEFLSIPVRTYKGYEYGESSLSHEVIDRISEKLGVSVSEMFKIEGEEKVIDPKTALTVLAKNLGYEIKLQPSLNSYFDSDLALKISSLGDKEIELLKRTVDRMIDSPAAKRKAN